MNAPLRNETRSDWTRRQLAKVIADMRADVVTKALQPYMSTVRAREIGNAVAQVMLIEPTCVREDIEVIVETSIMMRVQHHGLRLAPGAYACELAAECARQLVTMEVPS